MGYTEEGKKNRICFYVAVALCFVTVFVFEALTPMLADDFAYAGEVRRAASFADLFRQEYAQYRNWTGRSVAHLILRIFLYFRAETVFDLFAAGCFTGLSLLIYLNIERAPAGLCPDAGVQNSPESAYPEADKRSTRHDAALYTGIVLLLWYTGISFAETVLWETGACNYLLTTTLIMAFLTVVRRRLKREKSAGAAAACLLFLFGLAAGWCSENTSGGMILLTLYFIYEAYRADTGRKTFFQRHMDVCGALAGAVCGLALMVLAPGNYGRGAFTDEAHTGLLRYAARLLRLTVAVGEELLIPLTVTMALGVFAYAFRKQDAGFRDGLAFGVVSLLTVYALVMAPPPQNRALFGAGVFLITSLARMWQTVCEILTADSGRRGQTVRGMRCAVTAALLVPMCFTYVESGADLVRIRRELTERYAVLEAAAKEADAAVSDTPVAVPFLHTEFDNPFTIAYQSELGEDPDYWVNGMYSAYFGVNRITGVMREEPADE